MSLTMHVEHAHLPRKRLLVGYWFVPVSIAPVYRSVSILRQLIHYTDAATIPLSLALGYHQCASSKQLCISHRKVGSDTVRAGRAGGVLLIRASDRDDGIEFPERQRLTEMWNGRGRLAGGQHHLQHVGVSWDGFSDAATWLMEYGCIVRRLCLSGSIL